MAKLTPRYQFLWGMAGGFSLELIRLYKLVAASTPAPRPPIDEFYVVVTVGMILVAGMWSRALESEKKFLAFYHGGIAPLVLSFLFH